MTKNEFIDAKMMTETVYLSIHMNRFKIGFLNFFVAFVSMKN